MGFGMTKNGCATTGFCGGAVVAQGGAKTHYGNRPAPLRHHPAPLWGVAGVVARFVACSGGFPRGGAK